jgi:hypothetical protein
MTEDKKKYYVVCYMKVRAEDIELLTYEEAVKERAHCSFLQPENFYAIESIDDHVV